MEIRFDKVGNRYVAEFEAGSDFNLHMERSSGEMILFYQRTTPSGRYALINNSDRQVGRDVIDIDFTAAIWPKWIMIDCLTKPSVAEVTFAE